MTARKASTLTDHIRSPFDQGAISEGATTLADGMGAWFATASECQREMADFVSHRLAKDGDMVREMLGCRNPADAMDVHARWVREMIQDYSAETTRLLALYTKRVAGAGQRQR